MADYYTKRIIDEWRKIRSVKRFKIYFLIFDSSLLYRQNT